ncbi:hypothetical protein K402DRAFT_181716 [Aulographum hederae CBS 113979]|uniref:Uncharacterized protein n=1 Tax=Aulographum hederae CBS 113979 TaxID=1176131 RepID=A0A6G1GQ47_9PEZI|nr:hypothetical protein K402DRAFT_181716 [Aulographum hederae CBS 113979]
MLQSMLRKQDNWLESTGWKSGCVLRGGRTAASTFLPCDDTRLAHKRHVKEADFPEVPPVESWTFHWPRCNLGHLSSHHFLHSLRLLGFRSAYVVIPISTSLCAGIFPLPSPLSNPLLKELAPSKQGRQRAVRTATRWLTSQVILLSDIVFDDHRPLIGAGSNSGVLRPLSISVFEAGPTRLSLFRHNREIGGGRHGIAWLMTLAM